MKIISKLVLVFILLSAINVFAQEDISSYQKQGVNISAASLISVSIGGDFLVNGTFSALVYERLDHFLTRIIYQLNGNNNNSNTDSQSSYNLTLMMKESIKRNIRIIRTTGEEIVVDLDKFYLTGDLSQNPYLKQDDVILFSKINLETTYVVVNGAVNKRLKIPFVNGDKLSDAIIFAHGIDSTYENVNLAEIVRISYDGRSKSIDTVKLSNAENYLLKSGDVVTILGDVMDRSDYKVLVVGEVKNPGFVYVTKNNTTLREVINRAGGFKDNAWLEYAELVRGTTPANKVKQEALVSAYESDTQLDNSLIESFRTNAEWEIWKIFRTANLYDDHNSILRLDADLAMLNKNKLVDFSRIEDLNASENDFIVEDGDVIYIPEKMDLVYVMGQVANPGYYAYKMEYTLRDYLARAGGFTEAAEDESEIYIIKGKSYNWVQIGDRVAIDPGDYIWVRKDPARSFNFYLSRVSAITGIVGSIATIVLLVTQLIK